MFDVGGKGAFITGGASGMGLGMAKAFARAGMKVAIADIREDALDAAMRHFSNSNQHVVPVMLDVTNRDMWVEAADRAEAEIGNIHVLALNAGVGNGGPIATMGYNDWDFGLGVNLGGVVNGIVTMLPRMQRHGEDGYIFATSSSGGASAIGGVAVYCTSKYAIAGMMETIATELDGTPLRAGVSFPGLVHTSLVETTQSTRPARLRSDAPLADGSNGSLERPAEYDVGDFMSIDELGERVLRGVRRRDLFIITHSEFRDGFKARSDAILRAFPDEPIDRARSELSAKFGTLLYNPIYDKQGHPTELLA